VPTNAKIWLDGVREAQVSLSAGGTTIEAEEEGFSSGLRSGVRATPAAPLAAGARYEVVVVSGEVTGELRFAFTTGAGPDYRAPTPPPSLAVFTTQYLDSRNSCSPPNGYKVELSSSLAGGAVAYELAQLTPDGAWTTISISYELEQAVVLQALPSPQYRIRPLAITDVGAPEHALPVAQATRVDRTIEEDVEAPVEEERAGCGSVGRPAPSWSLGACAVLAALGLRRRRRTR
jgi:hypothetical protein